MKKTAIDIAYEYIEKMIVKGEWKVGDKITPEVRVSKLHGCPSCRTFYKKC